MQNDPYDPNNLLKMYPAMNQYGYWASGGKFYKISEDMDWNWIDRTINYLKKHVLPMHCPFRENQSGRTYEETENYKLITNKILEFEVHLKNGWYKS